LLRGHEGQVRAVAISPNSHWLVTGGQDRTVRLWDLMAKDPAANPVVLRGHDEQRALCWPSQTKLGPAARKLNLDADMLRSLFFSFAGSEHAEIRDDKFYSCLGICDRTRSAVVSIRKLRNA
jgi:WD40 repeat protein